MVQLDYYQRKLTYQLRIEQQFVTKDVDGSPTQLDIDSSKHQELESAKESIEVIKLRRATKKQTQCKRTRRAQGPAVQGSVVGCAMGLQRMGCVDRKLTK